MAVQTGTATDYLDLLNQLVTFLTGLVGTPWVVQRNTLGGTVAAPTGELIIMAPGNGGTDQIYVGVQPFANSVADYYNWRLAGFTGFSNSLAWAAQPGVMQNVFMTLWASPIPYWFVANGRRVIIVAKISTSYMMGYLGFLSSYHSPTQWPYPLFIGGNLAEGSEPGSGSTAWRWSVPDNTNHNFPFSSNVNTVGSADNTKQARLRLPNGAWKALQAQDNGVYGDYNIWPYAATMSNLIQNLGTPVQSPLLPIIFSDSTPEVYGEPEGVYATSGQGIASEDTLTVGTDSYLVVQDVFRTQRNQYCAVRLV